MNKSLRLHLLLTTSVLVIGALAQGAQAQQIIANGTIVSVPAGTIINTGTAVGAAGTILFATNNGIIHWNEGR